MSCASAKISVVLISILPAKNLVRNGKLFFTQILCLYWQCNSNSSCSTSWCNTPSYEISTPPLEGTPPLGQLRLEQVTGGMEFLIKLEPRIITGQETAAHLDHNREILVTSCGARNPMRPHRASNTLTGKDPHETDARASELPWMSH